MSEYSIDIIIEHLEIALTNFQKKFTDAANEIKEINHSLKVLRDYKEYTK